MGRRSWLLILLSIILKFDFAQDIIQDRQISMGLMPVTEMKIDTDWVTAYSTVPVDLLFGSAFIYLPPGAYRIKKNIFSDSFEFSTRSHDFNKQKV